MGNSQTEYVSLIGTAFIDPIASLIERLIKFNLKGPNEVQASVIENGYSASIIVLTVILIESVLNKTRFNMGKDGRVQAFKFYNSISSDIQLNQELEEVFVLRDAIAHNHVWSSCVEWNENGLEFIDSPERQAGYGDNKYRNVIDEKKRETRLLRLNLFPTRICLNDVYKVLNVANKLFENLEALDRRYCYISNESIEFMGEYITFSELIAKVTYKLSNK